MATAGRETEVKLVAPDLRPVRRRLRRAGFRVRLPRSFEDNMVFDSASRLFRRRGWLLRLRHARGRSWLTFKGPAAKVRRYKVRQETEVEVSPGDATQALLESLGFGPVFRYQKFRTVLAPPRAWAGGEVMLDETPIGNFVELEGSRRWIRQVAGWLGVSPDGFITKSYAALYTEWCKRQNRPVADMVFGRRK